MGRWLIVLGSALSATTPVFRHLLGDGAGWSSAQIAGARGLFGFLALALVVRTKIFVPRQLLAPVAIVAAAFTIGTGLFLYAYENAPAGVVITIVNVSPIWVALYERFFGEKRRQPLLWVALVFGLGGTLLMTKDADWSKRASVLPILAAFADSFVYAACVLSNRRIAQTKISPFIPAFWGLGLLTATFGWTCFSAHWTPVALLESMSMGLVSSAAAFTFVILGMRYARSATEVSLLLYTEIVFVWLYFSLGFGEPIRWHHLAGVSAIVASSLLASWPARKMPNPS